MGSKNYLRINDRKYFGGSQYRKSEGWIDVLSFTFKIPGIKETSRLSGAPVEKGDVNLLISQDPAIQPLLTAAANRTTLGNVQLYAQGEKSWISFALRDAIITTASVLPDRGQPKAVYDFTIHFQSLKLLAGEN